MPDVYWTETYNNLTAGVALDRETRTRLRRESQRKALEPLSDEQKAVLQYLQPRRVRPGGHDYAQWLGQAFNFMRQQSAGHYTDQSLMAITRAHDTYVAAVERGDVRGQTSDLPDIFLIDAEARFDEMTEVKYGGTIGMAIIWPRPTGKTMIAIQRQYRRCGLGRRIMRTIMEFHMPTAWVHRDNVRGQQFLLACGLQVTGFNAAGAVRFGVDTYIEEEEGAVDGGQW